MTPLQIQLLHAGILFFWAWFWYPKVGVTNTNNNNTTVNAPMGGMMSVIGYGAVLWAARMALAGYFAIQAGTIVWSIQ